MMKRAPGFGIGQRFQTPLVERRCKYFGWKLISYNFFALLESPPPGNYEHLSDFDVGRPGSQMSKQKAGQYTFGVSHEKYKRVY